MKLYCFQVAPNPTRVRLYLALRRAAGTHIDVSEVIGDLPAGEQREPAHLGRNPLGALPVLELADGSFLTESLAIIEYLEERNPDPPLIGPPTSTSSPTVAPIAIAAAAPAARTSVATAVITNISKNVSTISMPIA